MNLKLTKIDFLSSIIHASLSQVDILPVIWTLLNFALYVIKIQGKPLLYKITYLIRNCIFKSVLE